MHPDDDNPPPRPRWLGWALIAFGLLVALGMLNLGVRMVLTAKPPQAEAPGAVAPGPGTTASLAAECGPQPAPLRARTVTVYEVPFDSPVMVQPRPGTAATQERPPGVALAW